MKKYILSILSLSIMVSLPGCFAREMILTDPIVNFQEQGIKTILFVGFTVPSTVKVSPKFKEKLESNIYREFEKFNAVQIIKVDAKDKSGYKKDQLDALAKKYKADLVAVGDFRNYAESKIIDQPVPSFYDNRGNPDTANLRSLNRFQVIVTGNVSLIKPDGKVLWTQRIEELETVQFEGLPATTNPETDIDELATYVNTRNQLADNITSKIVRNLLPFYTYK